MFHVYKLGHVDCQGLANDFKNFRSNEKPLKRSPMFTQQNVRRDGPMMSVVNPHNPRMNQFVS